MDGLDMSRVCSALAAQLLHHPLQLDLLVASEKGPCISGIHPGQGAVGIVHDSCGLDLSPGSFSCLCQSLRLILHLNLISSSANTIICRNIADLPCARVTVARHGLLKDISSARGNRPLLPILTQVL
jgi:hypothetical protein